MPIAIEIPAVKLGVVEANGVRVEIVHPALAQEMESVCEKLRRAHTVEQVAELPAVRGVRAMFRAWGVDASRYRPSSEALLRRVVQGKGLYRVSNVVDSGNLGSIETGWPYGCYDRATVSPPIALRLGLLGEKYQGIGKQAWHLQGRPVLADTQGPFGSPISDSTRSMVTKATQSVLAVIYAPGDAAESDLQQAAERLAERLEKFAGARTTRAAVVFA